MKIAILITSYNRVTTTLRSLSALMQAADGLDFDVFLVDDASPDGTGKIVKHTYSKVKVISGSGNLYWAKGMRLAWETAISCNDYDFYLWLNDDVVLKSSAIRDLIADYEVGHGVIVGACSDDESEICCSYGITDCHNSLMPPTGTPQRSNGWLTGNCVLVPKDVYISIGMISAEYTHARADYDYAERLKVAGIPFFCSSNYVGVCRNNFAEKMKGQVLWMRIKMLYEPGYFNLHDLWLIRRRYHGVWRAICSCAHLILLVIRG